MTSTAITRRARGGRIAVAGMALSTIAALAATITVGSPTADAAPVRDADPNGATQIAEQIIVADAALRLSSFALPAAENEVTATAAALTAAVTEQDRVQSDGAPAPGVGVGGVAGAAAGAILDDLAPEGASSTRSAAEAAAAAAVVRRDELKVSVFTSARHKASLVASLEQNGQSRTSWCVALLGRLGAPVTRENLHALFAWIDAESNAASLLNPLATTEGAAGARDANSVGVKGYPSVVVGLDATVRTLHNGHYPHILDALARGNSALRVTQAVAASPWGTGGSATIRLREDFGG
ncbi:MAG: hypothetical protein WD598_04930 [Acidimicrobiia bacterium]